MTPDDAIRTVQPSSETELARVLAEAAQQGRKVAPRGGGTKVDWGNPPERADLVLSTLGLNRVLEHAAGDMTVTVEVGCTISGLQQVLAQRGQRLALDPLWPDRATVGGVIATNDSGSLRHAFGSVRDLVLGVTIALPDGTLARSGGKVVKNVAGYDLPKLMTGAMGTLGVITQATFRLHPLPAQSRTYEFVATTTNAANDFLLAVQSSTLSVTGLQVVAGHAAPTQVAVRIEGSPAGIEASAAPLSHVADSHRLASSREMTDPWSAGQRLWDNAPVVCKLTFLPARLAELCAAIPSPDWKLVAQGVGVGMVATRAGADELEEFARRAAALGGSLLVLRGPADLKRRVNSFETDSALPLMRAIKQKFDPSATLNPGIWGGGI